MGFFGRLFGKKEEEELPNFSEDTSLTQDDLHLDEQPFPEAESTEILPHMEAHQVPPVSRPQPITSAGTPQRDLELINSKLDTLKAILNSLDQRMANLEEAAGLEKKKRMPW